MKAIIVHEFGSPEVLRTGEVPTQNVGTDDALVDIFAAGVNFIDIYYRAGLYKTILPFVPGLEAAGVVRAVGSRVIVPKVGDRVAFALSMGAYAEQALVPAWQLVPLPSEVTFQMAAAGMVQGMTAHYLTHDTYALKSGETALVHAAAGGVGLLLVQMATHLGAQVIGTVSTDEKAQLATQAGADKIILYERTDFEKEVKNLTQDRGVDVVYDSVGRSTFTKSLNCLKPRGLLVLFGQSSGPVLPFDPQLLNRKGSLFLTRPSLHHYTLTRDELLARARDIFGWISEGKLSIRVDRTLPLEEAATAHRALASRQTTGKILLLPLKP